MKSLKAILTLLLSSFAIVLVFVDTTSAKTFNPGNIIDDTIFTNKSSMTATQIQQFLDAKGTYCTNGQAPCLKNFSENGRTAAQIIYDAAQQFNINPQTLIVTLQKEVGLVTLSQPASWRYQTAMGYGCPDTANCDSEYYGFTNQITWAARMFRAIMDARPTWYTPYVLGNNYIQYNPSASCGGSEVYIQNRATQALYNYTPYQPSPAALAAGYGEAPCGAYGNRNFWLYFNDWFGSTSGGDISVIYKKSGSPQYVLNDNKKYLLPDPATKIAWGLHALPDMAMEDAFVDSIPYAGVLTRYAQSTYTGQWYVVDAQKRFPAISKDIIDIFKGSPVQVNRYMLDMLPDGSSWMSPFLVKSDGSRYIVDSGNMHTIVSQDIFDIWNNGTYPLVPISDSFATTLALGDSVEGYKLQSNSSYYLVDKGLYTLLKSGLDSTFPGKTFLATPQLLNLLKASGRDEIGSLLQSDSGIVYFANGSERLAIPTMDQLIALSPAGAVRVSKVSENIMRHFSSTSILSGYITKNNEGKTYLLDKGYKRLVSPEVTQDYISQGTTIGILGSLAQFPDGASINDTMLHQDNGRVLIISRGKIYHITDLGSYVLWGGESRAGVRISTPVIATYGISTPVQSTFRINDVAYTFTEKGGVRQLSPLFAEIAADVPVFQELPRSVKTLSGILTKSFKLTDGRGCVVTPEGAFCTQNLSMQTVWNIPQLPLVSPYAISQHPIYPLTPFVESRTNQEVGISYKTQHATYHLRTPGQVFNFGWAGAKRVIISNEELAVSPLSTDWDNLLIKNSDSGKYYTFNNGSLLPLDGSIVEYWGTPSATFTDADIALAPLSNQSLTKSFQRNGDSRVLTIKDGHISWIRTLDTYARSYYPVTRVNGFFAENIPEGDDIP